MGLINTVIVKKQLTCPLCHGLLNHPLKEFCEFQTKDLFNKVYSWNLGERVTIRDGSLFFVSNGDATWKGTCQCYNCNAVIQGDILIKKGFIKQITNLKKYVV